MGGVAPAFKSERASKHKKEKSGVVHKFSWFFCHLWWEQFGPSDPPPFYLS